MPAYVAFLRAVNLGSHGKVSMSDLAKCITGLGLHGVKTLLNSGNVVFSGPERAAAEIEEQLEDEAEAKLGLRTEFMIRTAAELDYVVGGNPFPQMAAEDPGHLVVVFLKAEADEQAVERVRASNRGREQIATGGRQLYVTYPDGIGTSKLSFAKLNTPATGRNWNTVLKLQSLLRQ